MVIINISGGIASAAPMNCRHWEKRKGESSHFEHSRYS